jgi:cytochrome b subunit of formate dehydrogenase
MTATMIESHNFQRRTRTNHLVHFAMAVCGFCVAAAGIASTIVSLAQM